ncbi:MAG: hypothetical protein WCF20_12460 [Methylovirgula sp.]
MFYSSASFSGLAAVGAPVKNEPNSTANSAGHQLKRAPSFKSGMRKSGHRFSAGISLYTFKIGYVYDFGLVQSKVIMIDRGAEFSSSQRALMRRGLIRPRRAGI